MSDPVSDSRQREGDEPMCATCGHPVAAHQWSATWRGFVCKVGPCVCASLDPEDDRA